MILTVARRYLRAGFWGWAAASLLLASCQPSTKSQPEQVAAQPTAAALPVASLVPVAPAAPYTGYHRCRGTVGGQPVVVELLIRRASQAGQETCLGSYYYEKHGGQLSLQSRQDFKAGAPLVLAESAEQGQPTAAYWQAQGPAGPVVAGTWQSAKGGRRLPFALQEDYTGAVRYEIVRLASSRSTAPDEQTPAAYNTDSLITEFLHLLGPDTLRPAWRRLQCPPPAQRRAAARDATADSYLSVTLNGYGLLSYLEMESEDIGGAYPDNHNSPHTYDLATGRECDPLGWLTPGHETSLRKLLTRRLLADSTASGFFSTSETEGAGIKPYLAPLVHFGLNSAGLYCTLEEFGAPHALQGAEVTIPYAELRTLVRPGTPLARLLRQRGLRR